MAYQLSNRMSHQRFCGLGQEVKIPDRTTIWTFGNRIGEAGAQALFDGVSAQLLRQGYIARGGQVIDATLCRGTQAAQQQSREGAARLETSQTASEGPGCNLIQKARQILLRLQAVGER